MERHRQAKGGELLGSHQKCWLWGRHAVMESVKAGRWPIVELYLDEGLDAREAAEARREAARRGVKVKTAGSKRLATLCHSQEHQGYAARMGPFPYAQADAVLTGEQTGRVYAILDGIQDPHNFGAIVRSAEVLGVDGIFIGEKGQVGVTSAVARSSAGAASRLPIVRVSDVVKLIREMQALGIVVVGTSDRGEKEMGEHDFTEATAIVIGNEGWGMAKRTAQACDGELRIPQHGEIGSLNAAAAAAIFFHEALRQRTRGTGGRGIGVKGG